MSQGSLVLLALSLAADATAVAAVHGLAAPVVLPRHALSVGALFGGFHVVMPLLGWAFGAGLGDSLQAVHPWLAFGVLSLVGTKMMWDGLRAGARRASGQLLSLRALLPLALVTSVDALAVGVALPALDAPPARSLLTIGVTTALLSSAAVLLGRRVGALVDRRLDLAAGLVLVALGARVFGQLVG